MSTNVLTIVRHLLNLAEGKKTAIPAALTPEKLLCFNWRDTIIRRFQAKKS